MPTLVVDVWPYLTAGVALVLSTLVSVRVLLYKRDAHASIGWMGLVWLLPFLGSAFYLLFGINRVRSAARRRRHRRGFPAAPSCETGGPEVAIEDALSADGEHLVALAGYMERLGARPLVGGNRIEPLIDGDSAYPRMLSAIASARRTLALTSYIFNRDVVGQEFIAALTAAHQRGVDVRVIVDDVGALVSFAGAVGALRRAGVRATHFLPTFGSWRLLSINLHNHRKLLVVDGARAYLGGLNIDDRGKLALGHANASRDLHFQVEGPLVAQLMSVFALDWFTSTGERLDEAAWCPAPRAAGASIARAIDGGPDDRGDTIRWALLGAIACARRTVRVVSPYFLPDPALKTALAVAAERGVDVDVVIPRRTDPGFVAWAVLDQIGPLVDRGVRVWRTPPPFDHTKLMVVDGAWSLIGSANWDPRSLRLNFELVADVWDRQLAARLDGLIDARIAQATRLTRTDLGSQSLATRLRGGVARLGIPYF